MTPKKLYSFYIEPDLADALKEAKAREREMSEGAIIRRALREWMERHGVMKAARKRADTRKRA